jgi:hypothetical protein
MVGWLMVFTYFSYIVVEETGVPGENHRPVASPWQTLSQNVVSSTLTTLAMIGTGSCKFNYHMITTMMAPKVHWWMSEWTIMSWAEKWFVRFVYINGIIDYHCSYFLFIIKCLPVQSVPINMRFVSLIQKLGNVNLIQLYVVIFDSYL